MNLGVSGVWTPIVPTGFVITKQDSYYYKIDSMMVLMLYATLNRTTSTPSTELFKITGIPFNVSAFQYAGISYGTIVSSGVADSVMLNANEARLIKNGNYVNENMLPTNSPTIIFSGAVKTY